MKFTQRFTRFLVASSAALLAVLAVLAGAQAEVVCGGLNAKGEWIGDCGYVKAIPKGKPAALKCPAGSFLDIKGKIFTFKNSAECWKCPAGHRRSAAGVESHKACLIDAHHAYSRAEYHGKYRCKFGAGPSMFLDLGTNSCWSCPKGYRRTVHKVTRDDWACRVGLSKKWARATNHGPQCPPGTFKDPRKGGECWKCPAGYRRGVLAVTHNKACYKAVGIQYSKAQLVKKVGCPRNTFFDPIGGGSCWACPTYYTRAPTHVKGAKACRSLGFTWKTPAYREPGLFGYRGIASMASRIAQDPNKVTEFLRESIKATEFGGKDPGANTLEASVKAAWQSMLENVQESQAFNALIFYILQDAIANPNTVEKKAMVKDFAEYIRARRSFVAQDALNAYDAWYKADQWKRNNDASLKTAGLGSLFDYGTVPPDFQKLTRDAMSSAVAPAATLTMMTLSGVAAGFAGSVPSFSFIAPNAVVTVNKLMMVYKEADATRKAIQGAVGAFKHSFKIAGKGFTVAGKTAAFGGSKIASFAAAAAGPITIVTTAATIAYMAIDQLVKIENARPKLVNALNKAKAPLSLKALQDMGASQHVYYWSLLTSNRGQTSRALQAALKSGYDRLHGWAALPGNARDIAVASDGTAWIIGMDKVPGGYSIWNRGPRDRSWNKVPGGATRIAVAGMRVFVINDKGQVFQWDGKGKWVLRGNPGAKDIGASDAAVYIVGGKKVAGGYEVMQWKGGPSWKKWPGGAARIDVDANGDPWIVNDKGFIFARTKGKWRSFPGQGRDIGIHEPGKPAVIAMNGIVHFNDGRQWYGTARTGTNVAVAPNNGKVWHLSPKNGIFAQK